ncbi:MAG: protein kinase, partial [Planctomycetes bacterium]|nr:protein kinase [Planctomycetota bacterium]
MPPPPDRKPIPDQQTLLTPATGYVPARFPTPSPEAMAQQPTRITTVPPGSDVTRSTAPATMLRAPGGEDYTGQIWGDFEFGTLLGRGGMGAVYRGRQVSLDRPVAIKVLPAHLGGHDGFRARFELEAKAVAQINSPHVIQVYGAGVHEGHHFFAMEYVEGSDLSKIIRGGPRVGHAQALDFVTQAARGLVAAGELGIVHRDIKPGNMMVTAKGRLKLMDFGLVKLASEGAHHLTQTGTVMGTVSYFSPEQGRGDNCDTRTDLYALGVVFYELLTGRLPFTGNDATSVIYQHIHQAPRPPREIDPTIPEDFQAVVLKCMQKAADDRYPGAGELLADLDRLARGEAPAIGGHELAMLRQGALLTRTEAFRRERRSRRGRLAMAAGAVAVVAGAGAAAWWLLRPGGP